MSAPPPRQSDHFIGKVVESQVQPGTRYHLKKPIGGGGMGTVHFALRETPSGLAPVVVKIISPIVVAQSRDAAMLMVKKEAVALGRINEHVPPTPFVVRLIEAGFLPFTGSLELPWLAVEYVHGGLQGTTLTERVEHSIKHTGHAFDLDRAHNALRCLNGGLTAIHAVGVIHRDLTPGNILCCGFGFNETLKIADFGIARPSGMRGTFNAVMLGTPGYAAPEQGFAGQGTLGPWTDVFSLATITYYLLTGEEYFETDNQAHALMLAKSPQRRKLSEAKRVCPELREQPGIMSAVDTALEQATKLNTAERPPTVELFCSGLLSLLDAGPKSTRSPRRILEAVGEIRAQARKVHYDWRTRQPASNTRLIYRAAWSSDGRCLALTNQGLEHWDGTGWALVSTKTAPRVGRLSFVTCCGPGMWLVGGREGTLELYSGAGHEALEPGAPRLVYLDGSGDPDDLAAFIAKTPSGPPMLTAMAARRWLKPLPLEPDVTPNGIARMTDTCWVVCGRRGDGRGYVGFYEPLMWELNAVMTPEQPQVACEGQAVQGVGLTVGRGGSVCRSTMAGASKVDLKAQSDLACASVDVTGRAWVGGAGQLWEATAEEPENWYCAWRDESWETPFTSIFSDVGLVYALTAEGAILEGRAPLS